MMETSSIRKHVCSPDDPETVKRIFDIIEAEREDLQRYRDELERYKEPENTSKMPAHDTTNTLSSLIFTTYTRESGKGEALVKRQAPIDRVFLDDAEYKIATRQGISQPSASSVGTSAVPRRLISNRLQSIYCRQDYAELCLPEFGAPEGIS